MNRCKHPRALQAPVLGRLTNYRDEMRNLISKIAQYARSRKPGFVVITHNGMELLEKRDDVDKRKVYPARAYMLSIDAILQDGMFYGYESFGKPTSKEQKEKFAHLLDLAKRNRISMLTMDFARDPKKVDEVLAASSKQGFLPFVAHKELSVLNSLPPYPRRPFRENPNNVLSMSNADNYLYLGDTTAFGLETEFALKMHDTNYDMIITDVFHGRKPVFETRHRNHEIQETGGETPGPGTHGCRHGGDLSFLLEARLAIRITPLDHGPLPDGPRPVLRRILAPGMAQADLRRSQILHLRPDRPGL